MEWNELSLDDDVAAFLSPEPKLKKSRVCTVGWQLREWIHLQNTRGLAPTGAAVGPKRRELLHEARHTEQLVLPLAADRTRRSMRTWLSRWTQAQKLQTGKFTAGACLPLEEARAKVHPCRV